MLRGLSIVLTCLLVGACATARPPGSPPIPPEQANGAAVVTALGTPFYALFKATACVGSVIIAAPTAAGLALTDRPEREDERYALYAGVGENCYGSYVMPSS